MIQSVCFSPALSKKRDIESDVFKNIGIQNKFNQNNNDKIDNGN